MFKVRDLHGQRFGRLIVQSRVPHEKGVPVTWFCVCDCGNFKRVLSTNLVRGLTTSCGCAQKEHARVNMAKARATRVKHGLSSRREYHIWRGMIDRCYDPSWRGYHNYGGRGITVCEAWRNSPEQFIADMGPRPIGFSIERNDVNGNYEPANCRWAHSIEQGNNRRNNHMVTYKGVEMTLADAVRAVDNICVSPGTMRSRIRTGMPIEDAAMTPLLRKRRV